MVAMIDLSTPLITIDRPAGADDIARCIAAIALGCVGLTGREATRRRFGEQIGPRDAPESDRPSNAHSRQAIIEWLRHPYPPGPSTCGMVGESFHAQLGADAPTLYRPYVPGTAVSRAVAYLQRMGAWTDAQKQEDLEPRPQLGAYVVIGLTRPKSLPASQPWDWGGIEHVRTVVGWEGDELGDNICVSVDGGCVDPASGLQAVHLVRSRLVLRRGHPWLVAVKDAKGNQLDPATAPGRRILGWGDPGLMTWRPDMARVMVPEGWEGVG
jgi:hypothetical protein